MVKSYRSAPTDKNGLVLRPRQRDCVGESCPTVIKEGNCFTSAHHLYWPKVLYLESSVLAHTFRSDRHNIVSMAHCRHNSTLKKAIHSRYDNAQIPSSDVMATFLDESSILSISEVTASNMAFIVSRIKREQYKKLDDRNSMLESLENFHNKFTELGKKIVNFEIMPIDVVEEIMQPKVLKLNEIMPFDLDSLSII